MKTRYHFRILAVLAASFLAVFSLLYHARASADTAVIASPPSVHSPSTPDHALLMQLAAKVEADRSVIADLRSQVAAQQVKLNLVSATANHADTVAALAQPAASSSYGPFTVSGKNVYLTDYNLHIQSGSGSTGGKVNGYGNLIIGYNEGRGSSGTDVHTGSNNLIIGSENNYSGYGAIVGGFYNTSSAGYASVVGGRHGTASGNYSTVSGGYDGAASGQYASVSGGYENAASGEYSAAEAGLENMASGEYSAAAGGANNTVSGEVSSVTGGQYNTASGSVTSVTGGEGNAASDAGTSISGGVDNIADAYAACVSGGEFNVASNEFAAVSGGTGNTASGSDSTVSGGDNETEANDNYWKGGTYESK